MNPSKLFCSLLLLFVAPLFVEAQNYLTKVKLYPANEQQRLEMIGELQIDHFVMAADGGVVAEISSSDLVKLKQSRYKHDVLVADVGRWLDSANKAYFRLLKNNPNEAQRVAIERPGSVLDDIIPKPADFQVKPTFGGYYTFEEMEAAMNKLVADYPTIASKQSIGVTAATSNPAPGNRNIWVIKISDNVGADENEPEALFIGLQHPREAITGVSMIFFMQYLCEQYASNNPRIRELVNNREIFIIPCFNPDGYKYNHSYMSGNPGGVWRKNRRLISGSTYGVDLNRNWGVDWGNCGTPIQGNPTSCGSSTASTDTYYGTSAFSEAETQALRAFTKTRKFAVAFDQHAFGPYYSIPVGRESLHNDAHEERMSTKDSNFYTAVPALMGKYNGMRTANSFDALGYEVAGGFKDWMLMGENAAADKDTIWGLTGEGGAGGGTSSSFWAPASEIVNLCQGMCYQNLQLAYAAGSYAELEDATGINLPSPKTGSLAFNLTRLGIGNGPVTVSLLPFKNVSSTGTPVTINSMSYYQTATGSISYTLHPLLTAGQEAKFIWQIESDGIKYYDTVTKFYNATVAFTDNMEGSIGTNWSTATSGAGSSGLGYNYSNGTWIFTTGGRGGGNALSESLNGAKYDDSTRSIVSCTTQFDLRTSTAAYLTFWVRHRLENFRDKVQVQFSKNGTTWTPVKGLTTVQEIGTLDGSTINGQPSLTGIKETWTQERFDLSAFRGASDCNAIRFRFVFTSDDDVSSFAYEKDEGIFIDDVQLVRTNAALVILPVRFLSFTGSLQSDKTILLQWEANTDDKHSHYLVERSNDGISFSTIGRVNAGAPNRFVDVQPATGINQYRLRQVDKNTTEAFSKTITVILKPSFSLSVYPNPVSDKVKLYINADKASAVTITVTDLTGKTFLQTGVRTTNGTQEVELNVNEWPSQVYIIKATDRNNQLLSIQRLIKQ